MTLPPFDPKRVVKRRQSPATNEKVNAISAISATGRLSDRSSVAEIAEMAGSEANNQAGVALGGNSPPPGWSVLPQAWLSGLVKVEACGMAERREDAYGAQRLARLRSFAVRHAVALDSMGWSFWDVFGRLLDERCTFWWCGDRLELVDWLIDRLVLQVDSHRITVRKDMYRDSAIQRRATRATDPPELTLDGALLREGRGNGDLRIVMLELAYSKPNSFADIQSRTQLPSDRIQRALSDLRQHGLVSDAGLEVTTPGWERIARDLPTHAHYANARLKGYGDEDIPF